MRHYSRAEMEQVYDHIVGERMPGVGPQEIGVLSTVKRYRIGARMQVGDKVYHYGLSAGVCLDNTLAFMMNGQDSPMTAIGAGGAVGAGATRVTIVLGGGGGPLQNGAYPLNYLEGGSVIFFAAGGLCTRGIKSSTLVAAGGGACTIVVDRPIPFALIAADTTEVTASRYAQVVPWGGVAAPGSAFGTAIGLASLPSAALDYLWYQTWGPIWIATDIALGIAAQNRIGYVAPDGSIHRLATAGAEWQKAGTLICTAIGGAQGAPFMNLEIDP